MSTPRKQPVRGNAEVTGLQSAIDYCEGTAAAADIAVASIETNVAGLRTGDVSGEALLALNRAREGFETAAEAMRQAGAALAGGLSVRDAYAATGGHAGSKAFVQSDAAATAGGVDQDAAEQMHNDVLEREIRQAYTMVVLMAEEDGHDLTWVSLARVRDQLARTRSYSRAEVDAALVRLANEPDVHLQEEANRQALAAADWDAAVKLGGTPRHLLRIMENHR